MDRYDALEEPIPSEWLALDEGERMLLVREYHRRARIKMPNDRIHAAIHVIVENQSALGEELTVRRTLERLQTEGLDRHDAIHAVGSVVAARVFDIMRKNDVAIDQNKEYEAALELLTAESWRQAR